MNKKNRLFLISFLLLLAIAAAVFFTKYRIVKYDDNGKVRYKIEEISGTLKVLRDFAVRDTASIDKIFLADKQNNTILLERKSSFWTVNKDYIARRDFVDLLLETMLKIEVAAPVQQSKLDYVLRSLSTNSTKVEIYQKGKLTKTYYVGGTTQNNTGTYMILEGSNAPFEVHIPGFSGFLTTRYITSIYEWRDRMVFKYDVSDIRSVSLEFPQSPSQSFKAINLGNNRYELVALETGKKINNFDTLRVKEFIARYKNVGFESYLNYTDEYLKLDSILQTPILCRYTVEDAKGRKVVLKTYPRPNFKNTYDEEGNFYNNDVDRFYGVINNDVDLILLQYTYFDLLTKVLDDFRR